ncbi:hypothetical protein GCM10017576_26380 [Microbacterium barkeri]|uniref:Uncharacterized protein n=1 Tax=Microbacterium barkeri TaxID=33917 RepID=A0A9W6H4K8_9MICO|nr:hypothetical protein GCM10017576_26380 [Microbacterium barkeri]
MNTPGAVVGTDVVGAVVGVEVAEGVGSGSVPWPVPTLLAHPARERRTPAARRGASARRIMLSTLSERMARRRRRTPIVMQSRRTGLGRRPGRRR